MDPIEQDLTPLPEPAFTLTIDSQNYLREAGKWASFLGIVGFIFCALIVVMALFAGTMIATMSAMNPMVGTMIPAFAGVGITILYLIIAVVYFFYCLYLFQFGQKIKSGILQADQFVITTAFSKLKSFFKLWGILTIIIIAFYGLMLGMMILQIVLSHRV